MTCRKPHPTRKVINPGTGVRAWCPTCQEWRPAAQVPFGQERRNRDGKITATYAPVAH
jgi:hypothetical protein